MTKWITGVLAAGMAGLPAGQQAVLLYVKLSDDGFGASGETFSYTAFETELAALVEDRRVGRFDGHQSGDGYLIIHFNGPGADRIYRAIEPAVKARGLPAGSYVVKRYAGRDVRVELAAGP